MSTSFIYVFDIYFKKNILIIFSKQNVIESLCWMLWMELQKMDRHILSKRCNNKVDWDILIIFQMK
jgi:hypothetical protein